MERLMATRQARSTTRPSVAKTSDRERRAPADGTGRKGKPAPQEQLTVTATEYIRERAYYLSLERDECAADPIADWLRAERELTIGRHTD